MPALIIIIYYFNNIIRYISKPHHYNQNLIWLPILENTHTHTYPIWPLLRLFKFIQNNTLMPALIIIDYYFNNILRYYISKPHHYNQNPIWLPILEKIYIYTRTRTHTHIYIQFGHCQGFSNLFKTTH